MASEMEGPDCVVSPIASSARLNLPDVARALQAPSQTKPREGGQIVAVQFLRGIAAFAVVAEHLLQRYERRGSLPRVMPFHLGEVGVEIFFAISGFIMVYVTLRNPARVPTGRAFLRNRFLRIAPIYYLTTLVMVTFAWAGQRHSTAQFLSPRALDWLCSALFVPYRARSGLWQPIYSLGWTLNYEMFFYLLFAIGLSIRSRVWGIGFVIFGLVTLVAKGATIAPPQASYGFTVLAYVITRPIILFFLIGIALGLIRLRFGERLPRVPLTASAAIGVAVMGWAVMHDTLPLRIAAVFVALSAATLVTPGPWLRPQPLASFSRAIGDASYSIYLTHSFVLGPYALVTSPLAIHGWLSVVLTVGGGCLLCFAFGWVVWRLVELPLTERLRHNRQTRAELVAP